MFDRIKNFFRKRTTAKTKKKTETAISVQAKLFSTDISEIKCFATQCFFNRSYTGECSCDLKVIDIDATGRCFSFCDRAKAAAFIKEENKK